MHTCILLSTGICTFINNIILTLVNEHLKQSHHFQQLTQKLYYKINTFLYVTHYLNTFGRFQSEVTVTSMALFGIRQLVSVFLTLKHLLLSYFYLCCRVCPHSDIDLQPSYFLLIFFDSPLLLRQSASEALSSTGDVTD